MAKACAYSCQLLASVNSVKKFHFDFYALANYSSDFSLNFKTCADEMHTIRSRYSDTPLGHLSNQPLSRFKSVKSAREINAVLSRWPLHPDISLCCFTHCKLQDFTLHRGHRYLNVDSRHTSHSLHIQIRHIIYLSWSLLPTLHCHRILYSVKDHQEHIVGGPAHAYNKSEMDSCNNENF